MLKANPLFRDETFLAARVNADAATKAVTAAMNGKTLSQIGRVEISIIDVASPRPLAFKAGDLDYMNAPADHMTRVLEPGPKLTLPVGEQKGSPHRMIRPLLPHT